MSAQTGERVLCGKWSGTEVIISGEDLLITKASDLLGILDPPTKKPIRVANDLSPSWRALGVAIHLPKAHNTKNESRITPLGPNAFDDIRLAPRKESIRRCPR